MSSDLQARSIDWTNDIHKRIVAASLVEAAYNMEYERLHKNTLLDEKAAEIGDRLGFEIHDRLIDTKNNSYFGIIFKYKYEPLTPQNIPPKYIIAFRGTRTNLENIACDFILDIDFILHRLHLNSTRFTTALKAVDHIISLTGGGPEDVWLAGHSLGSAIALIVGRNMVIHKEIYLETYLFNPPFVAYSNIKPLGQIYWFGRSIVTAAASTIVHITKTGEEKNQVFNKLNAWKPNLFVNNKDRISNGYISYFKQRGFMNEIGAGKIENMATQDSVVSLIGEVFDEDFEPIHLIPSANLITTKGKFLHPMKAHGIKQWWQNINLSFENDSYLFNNI